jgi:hypothetical protein
MTWTCTINTTQPTKRIIIQQRGNHILREMSQVKNVIDTPSGLFFYLYYTLKKHSGQHMYSPFLSLLNTVQVLCPKSIFMLFSGLWPYGCEFNRFQDKIRLNTSMFYLLHKTTCFDQIRSSSGLRFLFLKHIEERMKVDKMQLKC